MIRSIRTVVVSEMKMAEFRPWFKKYIEYVNSRWPEKRAQGFWQRFDVPDTTCYFMTDHEDLAALDRWLKEAGADAGYVKLVGQMPDVLVEGAGYMVVLESV